MARAGFPCFTQPGSSRAPTHIKQPIRPCRARRGRHHLKTFALFILCCIVSTAMQASPGVVATLQEGRAFYEQGRYDEAIALLEAAAGPGAGNPVYHHLLAQSYGRAAENANWLKAMGLAKKTLAQLEIAVSLEPDNLQYLDDLKDYYRDAPGFLGGDRDKAREIEALIKKIALEQDQSGAALAKSK